MATTRIWTTEIARGVVVTRWDTFTVSGDVGGVLDAPHYPDKSVQVIGLPGGTTNIVIEGSNDAPSNGNFQTLVDTQGNLLSFFGTMDPTGIEQILDNPRYIRPRLDAITSLATSPAVIIVSRASLG